MDSDDEEQAARALVRKKLVRLNDRQSGQPADQQKLTRRLVGMLARKGFGAGLAYAVVRSEIEAAGGDSDLESDV